MEDERICDQCGEVIVGNDYEVVDGQVLCYDCIRDHCTTCDRCGDTIFVDNSYGDEHITVCEHCYNNYYHRCECCDRLIRDDDVYWENNLPYCAACYDDLDSDIEEYGYKPEPIFYGDGKRYLGVELEVDNGGKDSNNANTLKEIANTHHEHIYIKSDSSIDDGFEIVSHPMTLDYHMNNMSWKDIMKKAIQLSYRSHQTSTCGLHIHVNRNALGDTEKEQEEVISKILYFVEKHWNEIYTFSRRREANINRWAARYGFEKTGKEILDKAKNGSSGRYCAVNLCNYSTIEFRIFRGTLKYNTFIAALQLVDEICNAAVFMTESEIDKQSWSEFVQNITHKELVKYLKERRLYVNEEITTEEDM